jgi:hypothetical protein
VGIGRGASEAERGTDAEICGVFGRAKGRQGAKFTSPVEECIITVYLSKNQEKREKKRDRMTF